jgi:hypothetical protein
MLKQTMQTQKKIKNFSMQLFRPGFLTSDEKG